MGLSLGAVRVIVLAVISTILAVVAVALRLWSKYLQRTRLAFHDWMAISAMVLALASVVNDLVDTVHGGLGEHFMELVQNDPQKIALYFKLEVPAQLLWAAANSCVKISILSLYTAILPGRKFRWICHGLIGLTSLYLISVVCEAFVLCSPVQYNWDKSIEGVCTGQSSAYMAAAIINLLIDSMVVALPMPKLFGLQMSLTKRLSVISMFSLGGLICIVSLLRVISISRWDLNDITYTSVDVLIYSVLEPTLGIVNCCLPTIKPAILAIMGKRPHTQNAPLGYSYETPGSWRSAQSGTREGRSNRSKGPLTTLDMTDFDRLDDEYPLTDTRIERGGTGNVNHNAQGITIERQWQVNGS